MSQFKYSLPEEVERPPLKNARAGWNQIVTMPEEVKNRLPAEERWTGVLIPACSLQHRHQGQAVPSEARPARLGRAVLTVGRRLYNPFLPDQW